MTRTWMIAVWATVGLLLFAMPTTRGQEPTPKTPVLTAAQQRRLEQAAELNETVFTLYQQGKAAEALPIAKQALNIRRQILGDEHSDTALSFHNVGAQYEMLKDYAAARPYYEQSLKIWKKVLGDEHPNTTTCLHRLGCLLNGLGDYAAARPYLEQTLEIRKKLLGDEHPDTADSLGQLGLLLNDMGDYAAAQPYLEQALKISKKVLGDKHRDTAAALNNLGVLLKSLGDFSAARTLIEQALKINKKVLGDEHPQTANTINNMGILSNSMGDYAAARMYYEEALKIRKKVVGDDHPDTAFALNNLGALLVEIGDYATARSLMEQALKIRERTLGSEHIETAGTLNNLGVLLDEMNDYAAARSYHERALKIRKKVLGDEHPRTATSLNNLGTLLRSMRDYVAARKCHEEAFQIRKKVLGEEHPVTTISVNHLGHLHEDTGNFTAARLYYEQSLKIRKQALGDDHPDTANSLNLLAALCVTIGDWPQAIEQYDQARRASRRHVARVLLSLSEKEQLIFLKQNEEAVFRSALTLAWLRRGEHDAAGRSAGWLLNGKGIAHASLAERTLLARDSRDPRSATLVNQLLDARRRLAQFSLASPKSGHEAEHRQQWDALSAREIELARKLALATARPELAEPWVELADVRQALTNRSRLIDIARFDVRDFHANPLKPARYLAWVIPPAGLGDVQIVDLGEANVIDEQVEQILQLIANAGMKDSVLLQEGEPEAVRQLQEQLAALAKQIWLPLAPHVADAETLLLSPDASLWLVPWGALPTGNADEFLIEKFAINYLVSGRDVVATSRRSDRTNPPTVFANPDFDLTPADVLKQVKAILRDRAPKEDDISVRSLSPTGKSALPKVTPLPGTAQEAQAITPLLKSYAGEDPQVYTAKNSLESVVKVIRSPRIAVLATHGFFLPDQEVKRDDRLLASSETRSVALTVDGKPLENPLLRCGLLFAGCNAPGAGQGTAGDDGVLTGLEIVGLDLRGTELVVLSACETGVGQVRNGEGVAGLRQAFQLAGAEAVIATLWQVPDAESAELMGDFFAFLNDGSSKSQALRKAQLKQIAKRRELYSTAHPYYWAAFTITGR